MKFNQSLQNCSETERAIRCFEMWSNTTITISDSARRLVILNGTVREKHTSSTCLRVKSLYEKRCNNFCWRGLSKASQRFPEGGVKICHAGVLDWFIPVFHDPKLLPVILTASGRRAPAELPALLPIYREALIEEDNLEYPPLANQTELLMIHEGLVQLAARLRSYLLDHGGRRETDQIFTSRLNDLNFLIDHSFHLPISIRDAARHFHLSPSRTAHTIQELTGKSFSQLLAERRIHEAQILLRHSGLPIGTIATKTGFPSENAFRQKFNQLCKMSPRDFRKSETAK